MRRICLTSILCGYLISMLMPQLGFKCFNTLNNMGNGLQMIREALDNVSWKCDVHQPIERVRFVIDKPLHLFQAVLIWEQVAIYRTQLFCIELRICIVLDSSKDSATPHLGSSNYLDIDCLIVRLAHQFQVVVDEYDAVFGQTNVQLHVVYAS